VSEKAALKELLDDYSLSSACVMIEADALRKEGEHALAALVESYLTIEDEIKRILSASTN